MTSSSDHGTILGAENLLSQINPSRRSTYELRVPATLVDIDFGGLASYLQWIVTAMAASDHTTLIIESPASSPQELADLVQEDHLLVSCLLAETVENSAGLNITFEVQEAARAQVAQIEASDHLDRLLALSIDGPSGFVSHALGPRDELGSDESLIDRSSRLVHGLRALIPGARAAAWPGGDTSGDAQSNLETEAASFLFELIDNTARWGAQEWTAPGVRSLVDRSARMIRATYVDRPLSGLRDLAPKANPLEVFLRYSLPSYVRGKRSKTSDFDVRALEITIFDAGRGLGYWLAAEGSHLNSLLLFDDEIRTTGAALLGGSGSRSTIFFNAGKGIPRALEAISRLGGFIRVRTGRLSLYRDFVVMPFDPAESDSEALLELNPKLRYFWDWTTQGDVPTEHAPTRGTVYSIFLPVFDAADRRAAQ